MKRRIWPKNMKLGDRFIVEKDGPLDGCEGTVVGLPRRTHGDITVVRVRVTTEVEIGLIDERRVEVER